MKLRVARGAAFGRVAGALVCAVLCGCVASSQPGAARTAAAGSETAADRQIVVTVRTSPARTAQHAGSTPKAYDAAGRYQVSPAALRDAAALARRYDLRQLDAWPIELLDVHCIVYAVEGSRPLSEVLATVSSDPRVESAQPLVSFRTQTSPAYDDPYVGLQSGVATLQIVAAHRWSRGRGVRIAVIDSGIDATHPDLAGRIALSRDFTGNAGSDTDGDARLDTHGIAVAGVIAATAGNGVGIVGIAPEARLLALRACWQVRATERQPAESRCNTFTLAQAIAMAIAERADIINLSLTGPPDPLLARLLARAMSMGKIVVAAVPEADSPGNAFPAMLDGVLAVGSAEARPLASAQATTAIAGELHAPGRNVLTLRPKGRYDFENGSSMAAASVSGVAALLLSVRSSLSSNEIRQLLLQNSAMPEKTGTSATQMINACAALAALMHHVDCGAPTTVRNAGQP
ncbi:MAG: S8 family serine peptidase [Pseudomonadota bacterium]